MYLEKLTLWNINLVSQYHFWWSYAIDISYCSSMISVTLTIYFCFFFPANWFIKLLYYVDVKINSWIVKNTLDLFSDAAFGDHQHSVASISADWPYHWIQTCCKEILPFSTTLIWNQSQECMPFQFHSWCFLQRSHAWSILF